MRVTSVDAIPIQTPPIAEIISLVRALSRNQKFKIAQVLLDDLAKEDQVPVFEVGKIYPIYTPTYSPGAAAQLALALIEEKTGS